MLTIQITQLDLPFIRPLNTRAISDFWGTTTAEVVYLIITTGLILRSVQKVRDILLIKLVLFFRNYII